jgi:hypothetical protein
MAADILTDDQPPANLDHVAYDATTVKADHPGVFGKDNIVADFNGGEIAHRRARRWRFVLTVPAFALAAAAVNLRSRASGSRSTGREFSHVWTPPSGHTLVFWPSNLPGGKPWVLIRRLRVTRLLTTPSAFKSA